MLLGIRKYDQFQAMPTERELVEKRVIWPAIPHSVPIDHRCHTYICSSVKKQQQSTTPNVAFCSPRNTNWDPKPSRFRILGVEGLILGNLYTCVCMSKVIKVSIIPTSWHEKGEEWGTSPAMREVNAGIWTTWTSEHFSRQYSLTRPTLCPSTTDICLLWKAEEYSLDS